MNLWNAFFVLMAAVGVLGSLYLAVEFLRFHAHHRRIARNRRFIRSWPKSQHPSYFRDYK